MDFVCLGRLMTCGLEGRISFNQGLKPSGINWPHSELGYMLWLRYSRWKEIVMALKIADLLCIYMLSCFRPKTFQRNGTWKGKNLSKRDLWSKSCLGHLVPRRTIECVSFVKFPPLKRHRQDLGPRPSFAECRCVVYKEYEIKGDRDVCIID